MSRSSQASPRLLAALAVAGVVSIPAVGWAAEAIEEVVVTAQRTEQSVQEVPIAVSAFSGEMMEDKQIINPSDLQLAAPNVSFTATNFGGSSFSIRGIGRLVIAGSGENGVSIHQNQIAVPTNLPAAEFYDLERVEVLRGPQGTLFGRNATGGAVNMVTKMPDFESWNGNWDVETGDYSHRRIKGALNIPVTDNFAIRMAGMALERDGYIENTAYKQRGDCVIPGTTLVEAYGPSANNPNVPNSANIQSGNINPNVTQPCSIANIDDDIDGRDITTYRITAAWQILDNMTPGCSTPRSARTMTRSVSPTRCASRALSRRLVHRRRQRLGCSAQRLHHRWSVRRSERSCASWHRVALQRFPAARHRLSQAAHGL